jgi:4-amino-4-deoxy-L-arabinose transferase-like glycosyltransferase
MGHAAIQLVFSAAIGVYLIVFARITFSQPERMRQRWYSWLPERQWTSTLLRCYAVFVMVAGFLLMANGLFAQPFLALYRGVKLQTCIVILAVVFAGLLAANTPRRQWFGR